jgi:hypothetical protein
LERAGGGDWEKFVRKAMQKILSPPLMKKKLIFCGKRACDRSRRAIAKTKFVTVLKSKSTTFTEFSHQV